LCRAVVGLLVLILSQEWCLGEGLDASLRTAAFRGDVARVKQLLAKGANANAYEGAVMINFTMGWTPLMDAAAKGNVEILETLIAAGANVNTTGMDDAYLTVSAIGIARRNPEMIKLLRKAGAIPDLRTAIYMGDVNTVKMWLAGKPNVNGVDRNGNGPINYAISAGQTNIVELLKKAGATGEGPEVIGNSF